MIAAQIIDPRFLATDPRSKSQSSASSRRQGGDFKREPLGRNLFFPRRMLTKETDSGARSWRCYLSPKQPKSSSQVYRCSRTGDAHSSDKSRNLSPARNAAIVGLGVFNTVKPSCRINQPNLGISPTLETQSPAPDSFATPVSLNRQSSSLRRKGSHSPHFGPWGTKRFADSEVTTGTFISTPGPGYYQEPSDFDTIKRIVYGVGRYVNGPTLVTKATISKAPRFTFARQEAKLRDKAVKALEEGKKAPGPGAYEAPSAFGKVVRKGKSTKGTPKPTPRPTPTPPPRVEKNSQPERTEDSGYKDRNETVELGPLIANKKTAPNEWPLSSPPVAMLKRSKSTIKDLLNYEPINKTAICMDKSAVPEVVTIPLQTRPQDETQTETKEMSKAGLLSKVVIRETILTARISHLPRLYIFFCILFSLALLIGGLFYIAFGYTAAFDKRGKEAYFDQDHTERTLQSAIKIKAYHSAWTMRTDDWGYIQRAYEEDKNGSNTRWSKYNVHNEICIVCVICGVIWIVANALEVIKFTYAKWRLTLWCLLLNVAAIILFAIMNWFILSKLNDFNQSNKKLWSYCNCAEFKSQYYISIKLYVFTTIFVGCIAIVQLVLTSVFCCWIPCLLNH